MELDDLITMSDYVWRVLERMATIEQETAAEVPLSALDITRAMSERDDRWTFSMLKTAEIKGLVQRHRPGFTAWLWVLTPDGRRMVAERLARRDGTPTPNPAHVEA